MHQKLVGLLASLVLATASVVVMAPPATADGGVGAAYVAFGDSFGAGTGVPPYASDNIACLRSQSSGYPTLLSKARAFRGLDDMTCSGATTASISAQLADADIGPNTRSVTVTVGGNDIGWSLALMSCMGNPQACSAAFADVASRIPAVKTSISTAVREIAAEAPNAEIYVTGYPYLFGDFRGNCTVGTAPTGQPIIVDRATATSANTTVAGLNWAIAAGVAKSGEKDATYVDVAVFSLRNGLCGSGTDWINGVQFSGASPLPQSLHPNRWGEKSYAGRELLTSWLN